MKQMKRIIALLLVLTMVCAGNVSAFAAKKESATYTMPYYIEVDIANQITTVYSTEDNSIVRQMICTTGMGDRTPRGTYIMPVKKYDQDRQEWYYFPEFKIYAKYGSRIYGGILFHSILFSSKSSTQPTWASTHALGSKASHGCIRLRIADAKWIAENALAGTQVRIFDDGVRDEELRTLLKAATYIADGEVSYEEFLSGVVQLSRGAKLDSVTKLQEQLTALGYSCGSADGNFGANTEKAVMAWQADHGYEQDGTVSPSMYKEILACTTPEPTVTPEPTPMPEISSMKYDTAVVHTETWLNVRSAPNKDASLLGKINNKSTIHVLSNDGEWAMIDYNGTVGYVSAYYFTVTVTREPDPTPEPTPVPTATPTAEPTDVPQEEEPEEDDIDDRTVAEVRDLASRLNVRADASTSSAAVAQLNSGERVYVNGKREDWVSIQMDDGTEGFVMSKYLILDVEIVPELPDDTPAGTPATVNNKDGLNLFREASENGGLITHLKNNQQVYVREDAGEWVWVYARGFVGYLAKDQLDIEEEDTAA